VHGIHCLLGDDFLDGVVCIMIHIGLDSIIAFALFFCHDSLLPMYNLGIAAALAAHKVLQSWICCQVSSSVSDPIGGMPLLGIMALISSSERRIAVVMVDLVLDRFL
jgi:hypothetical protein